MCLFYIYVEGYNILYIYYLMILVMKEISVYVIVFLKYWIFYVIFLYMKIRIVLLFINNCNYVL